MDIKTYVAERGAMAVLAKKLNVSHAFLWQLVNGRRSVSAERATQIEIATDGKVRRWDLRPTDWHRVWPELVGVDGAPPVPTTPAAEEQAA